MPNYVSNQITFDAARADEIFAALEVNGKFSMGSLIPMPLHVYRGDLGTDEEEDFPDNWLSWGKANWGTKWDACESKTSVADGKAILYFETAWSVPYPFIAAFCNRFQIPFEHRYFDEGENFWGVEQWGASRHDGERITRLEKRHSDPDDLAALQILFGYVPEEEEEVAG